MSQKIHPYDALPFAGGLLDRMDARRRDAAWVDAQIASSETSFLPVWRGRSLIGADRDQPAVAFVDADLARSHLPGCPWALLGMQSGRAYVAVDLSALDDPLPDDDGSRFEDLRRVGSLLPAADAAILAHARGLMHWRTRHRFCGVCGAVCAPEAAGHVMACSGCGAHHFPRTDPAVIMLVTHGDRALLGQPTRFREMKVFTTLAGFVEPGESLEEAVVREVLEESGVQVANVRYRASQPWPFPASIMLGFTAEAVTQTITIDPHELVAADWFTREQLRSPDGFVLPPPMSIARRLMDDWIAEAG